MMEQGQTCPPPLVISQEADNEEPANSLNGNISIGRNNRNEDGKIIIIPTETNNSDSESSLLLLKDLEDDGRRRDEEEKEEEESKGLLNSKHESSSTINSFGGDISAELEQNFQFPQQPEPVQLDHVSSTASAAAAAKERDEMIVQVEEATTTTTRVVVEETAAVAESHAAMQAVTRSIVISNNNSNNDDSVKYPVNGNNNVSSEVQSIPNMDNNMICWEGGVGHLPGSDLKFRMNEFGLMEILDDEAFKRVYDEAGSNSISASVNEANIKLEQSSLPNGSLCGHIDSSGPEDMEIGTTVPEKDDDKMKNGIDTVQDSSTSELGTGDNGPSRTEIKAVETEGRTCGVSSDKKSLEILESITQADNNNAQEHSENAKETSSSTATVAIPPQADSWADMETQRIEVDGGSVENEKGLLKQDAKIEKETMEVDAGGKLVNGTAETVDFKDKRDDENKVVFNVASSDLGVNRNAAQSEVSSTTTAEVKQEVDAPDSPKKSAPSKPDQEPTNLNLKLPEQKDGIAVALLDHHQNVKDFSSLETTEKTIETGKLRSTSTSSEELSDVGRSAPVLTEERNDSRTPSPVFHLPPPPPIPSNSVCNNEMPVLHSENGTSEDMKDLVFCKCCGCFGLQQEFYQSLFCTKACGDSYKYQTQSPDGRFRRPMPVTPKKLKILSGSDTGSPDSNSDGRGSSGERGSVSPLDKGKKKKQKSPPASRSKISAKAKAIKAAAETEAVEKTKNPRRLSATKSTAFQSKDRKRNFPSVLSKRMPTSPERKLIPDSITKEAQLSPDITQVRTKHFPTRAASGSSDFDWKKYLAETNSKSAPHRLFRQPAMPPENPFKSGWMLESIDPQHQSLICVTTVVETQGYRVRLRFQGFSEAYDYWVNADSLDIFPAGWCEENNLELQPPPGASEPFSWVQYLEENQLEAAPRHIFGITKEDFTVDSGVRPGMKLEAVDIRNQNLVCVATVAKVMGERILVHFDSWDSLYDYWTDLTSPYIHPIGWCDKNNVKLTPPNYIKTAFSWEQYLLETSSVPMPAKLFRPLPPVGFRKGFKVECVDKRNPFLVRVATIADVEKHSLVIHFDNWPSMYDYSVYELSPDIHPVGWCAHTGHPLQPPPPPDGSWKGPCTIFGCLGLGHIRGPKFLTHNSEKNCPYAPHNYKKDWVLADRVIVFERNFGQGHLDNSANVEVTTKLAEAKSGTAQAQSKVSTKAASSGTAKAAVVPKSATVKRKRSSTSSNKEPNQKKPKAQVISSSPSASPVSARVSTDTEIETKPEIKIKQEVEEVNDVSGNSPMETSVDENDIDKKPVIVPAKPQSPPKTKDEPGSKPTTSKKDAKAEKDADSPGKQSSLPSTSTAGFSGTCSSAAEPEMEFPPNFAISSAPLKAVVGDLTEATVNSWKVEELASLIAQVRGCEHTSNLFLDQLIDGESFLMLSQADFVNVMGLKLGPAVKLSNVIKLIKFNSVSANLKGS